MLYGEKYLLGIIKGGESDFPFSYTLAEPRKVEFTVRSRGDVLNEQAHKRNNRPKMKLKRKLHLLRNHWRVVIQMWIAAHRGLFDPETKRKYDSAIYR